MKRLVYGMSMKRKELGDYIDNHTWQVIVALAQLYPFPHGNRVHWRKEVWEKFSKVYILNKSDKLPNADFIYSNSWGRNTGEIGNALQYAKDKESDYTPQEHATVDEFWFIVQDYFLWLSDKLSQNSTVTLAEVKDELDRLGLTEVVD